MFSMIVEIVNVLPDAVRFAGMDALASAGILDEVAALVRVFGYILFEDGSIGTRS